MWDDFDTIKKRVATQWKATPKKHNPVSAPMQARIEAWIADFEKNYFQVMNAE